MYLHIELELGTTITTLVVCFILFLNLFKNSKGFTICSNTWFKVILSTFDAYFIANSEFRSERITFVPIFFEISKEEILCSNEITSNPCSFAAMENKPGPEPKSKIFPRLSNLK